MYFEIREQEYDLALWQCYGRYLKHFGDMDVEEITEVAIFKKVFFPLGFDGVNAGFTVSIHASSHNQLCISTNETTVRTVV